MNRNWIYTLNNYTEGDIAQLQAFTVSKHRCCKEVGDEGVKHLQGAVTFKRNYRLTQLKKLNPRAHWEVALSKDAENYCTKGEIIIDVKATQGKRNDILDLKAELDAGGTLKEVINNHFGAWLKYRKNIEEYKASLELPRDFQTTVILLWGEPGSGKTRYAIDDGSRMVDYYNGKFSGPGIKHEKVCFDEVDSWDIPKNLMLKLCDRYELTIDVKYGSSNWKPKVIYMTSNRNPQEWSFWCPAFERRVTKIIELNL